MQLFLHCNSSRVLRSIAALALCAGGIALLPSCKRDTAGATTAAPALDLSSPKKAGVLFAKAIDGGDLTMARQACVGTDEQFAGIKGMSDMMSALHRFNAAAEKKFGAQGKLGANLMPPNLAEEMEKRDEKIDGDKATLVNKDKPGESHPMTLKKDGGNWKVDLSSMPPQMLELGKSAKKITDGLDAVTKDVEGGKFPTPATAQAAALTAMNPDVQ